MKRKIPLLLSLIVFVFAGVLAIGGCGSTKSVKAHDGTSLHDLTGPRAAASVAWGDVVIVTDYKPDGGIRWARTIDARSFGLQWAAAPQSADDGFDSHFATVMTAGKNHALETEFRGGTAVTTWYIGLISSSGYSAISAADTLASHAGWTEGTPYSGNRIAWTPGAASAGATTNSSPVAFTINATLTVKGMFLASASSGTTGTLMSAALFSGGDASVISGDTLNVTYTYTLTKRWTIDSDSRLVLDLQRGPILTPVRLMNPNLFARKEEVFAFAG